jgi:hypothetical protein
MLERSSAQLRTIVLNSMDTYYVSRYSGSLPQLPEDIDDEDYW